MHNFSKWLTHKHNNFVNEAKFDAKKVDQALVKGGLARIEEISNNTMSLLNKTTEDLQKFLDSLHKIKFTSDFDPNDLDMYSKKIEQDFGLLKRDLDKAITDDKQGLVAEIDGLIDNLRQAFDPNFQATQTDLWRDEKRFGGMSDEELEKDRLTKFGRGFKAQSPDEIRGRDIGF